MSARDAFHPAVRLTQYRQIMIDALPNYANAPVNGEIQTVPIFDVERDHYQLLDMGWDESGRRVFEPMIHIDLLGGKVWIQENMTDLDIARVLVDRGIASSDIVLGPHSRPLRRFGEYAIE